MGSRLQGGAARASLPSRLWTELYFQTVHDPSVAPFRSAYNERLRPVRAAHLRRGDWDSRREEVKDLGDPIDRPLLREHSQSRFSDVQVLGPPDIEREVGLTGGHIFQGECLPPYMWDKRLSAADADARTSSSAGPVPIPGGSVIAINGRNAAMEVLGEPARVMA